MGPVPQSERLAGILHLSMSETPSSPVDGDTLLLSFSHTPVVG